MSRPPELAELSRALDTLSRGEVRYLCMQLGVRPATLSNIDASPLNDPLTCMTKYLEAWLACEGPLSWDMIVEGLSSATLGKTALASRIKRNYCSSACDPVRDAPSSPVAVLSASAHISESDSRTSETSSGIELATFVKPISHFNPLVDSLPELKPAPSLSSPPQTNTFSNQQQLAKKITSFKRRFRAIVISANLHLSQKMSRTDFDRFKIDLITLPMLGRTHHFLQRKRKKIRKAKNVQKVFEILDPYWNHVDYALLEHIVVHYCDEKIKQEMEKYKHKLHRFEKATSVRSFKSVVTERSPVPSSYSGLSVTLDKTGEECSLYHVRQIKESITERGNLEPYVTLLESVHSSLVVLTIAFPHSVRSHMEQTLRSDIRLTELGILPSLVNFCDVGQPKSTFSRVRDFLSTKKTRREEITYTVRHCDLKPRYKDLGPEAVEVVCKEIKTQISDQDVTLELQWKSREVKFHICGLEEGVTTALGLLQQKVLKSESQKLLSKQDQEESFSLMPDPPKNVREKLIYVINYLELKAEFRTLKSGRVRSSCEAIESQTQDQVSVQFQWLPDSLEFTVSGLEESVATALQLIQEEFEVSVLHSRYGSSPVHETLAEPRPTPLTADALRLHDEQMQTKVRQFHCQDCNSSWWMLAPANKPVSRCKKCHKRFDAIARGCEFGVGRFTCPNSDCRNVFYAQCSEGNARRECIKCSTMAERPYIHPRHKKRTTSSRIYFYIFASKHHFSTGSTQDTWLTQPASLATDQPPPRYDTLPPPCSPLLFGVSPPVGDAEPIRSLSRSPVTRTSLKLVCNLKSSVQESRCSGRSYSGYKSPVLRRPGSSSSGYAMPDYEPPVQKPRRLRRPGSFFSGYAMPDYEPPVQEPRRLRRPGSSYSGYAMPDYEPPVQEPRRLRLSGSSSSGYAMPDYEPPVQEPRRLRRPGSSYSGYAMPDYEPPVQEPRRLRLSGSSSSGYAMPDYEPPVQEPRRLRRPGSSYSGYAMPDYELPVQEPRRLRLPGSSYSGYAMPDYELPVQEPRRLRRSGSFCSGYAMPDYESFVQEPRYLRRSGSSYSVRNVRYTAPSSHGSRGGYGSDHSSIGSTCLTR